MDAKYIAEIRTRAQEAKVEKQKGNDLDCACLSWAIVLNDLPALLDEVERLTKENSSLENEYRHYRRLSEKLDQQIATLKKALETVFSEFGRYLPHDMEYFIQQAKQTHESQKAEE